MEVWRRIQWGAKHRVSSHRILMYCISVPGFHIEEDLIQKIELFCAHWKKQNTKAHQTYVYSHLYKVICFLILVPVCFPQNILNVVRREKLNGIFDVLEREILGQHSQA